MKSRYLVSAVVAVLGTLAFSCGTALPDEALAGAAQAGPCTPITRAARDLAYGPAHLQKLDVYPAPAASCDQSPVVVWVHGGGWRVGDKARLESKRGWAHQHGWTLVSVNYRLSDPDVPTADRVRYPTHNRDVGRAVSWVFDHIARYGGDPTRIALVGHSAGAQIVSSVGVDEDYLPAVVRPSVCGVVSLDTEGYDVEARIRSGGRTARLYRNAFGNVPAVWRDASPVNHLDAGDAPQLVIRRGTLRRERGQAAYARALRDAGIDTTVVPTPGYSHEDVNRLLGSVNDDLMTPHVEDFLDACFAG
ncbi:MAG TPA: alpha/beta hydrolase [Acidimicrobiales bacterium]